MSQETPPLSTSHGSTLEDLQKIAGTHTFECRGMDVKGKIIKPEIVSKFDPTSISPHHRPLIVIQSVTCEKLSLTMCTNNEDAREVPCIFDAQKKTV